MLNDDEVIVGLGLEYTDTVYKRYCLENTLFLVMHFTEAKEAKMSR